MKRVCIAAGLKSTALVLLEPFPGNANQFSSYFLLLYQLSYKTKTYLFESAFYWLNMENQEGKRAATCGDNNRDQKELYL